MAASSSWAAISIYDRLETPDTGIRWNRQLLVKRARMEGFLVWDWRHQIQDFRRDVSQWLRDGKVHYKEDVAEGIASAPRAFMGMLAGREPRQAAGARGRAVMSAPATAAVDYDPRRPEVIANPFPIFAALRERDPVHWSEALGGWVLTRYRDVRLVSTDPRFSADRITPFRDHLRPDARAQVAELLKTLGMWAVFNDPPAHTRRRGLLNKAFTPRAVMALRPLIERIVAHLISRVAGRGEMDLIAAFAYPLPASVIAGMIGVPIEDLDRFKTWSDEIAAFVGSALATPDKRERGERGAREMSAYFRGIIADHRKHPRDGHPERAAGRGGGGHRPQRGRAGRELHPAAVRGPRDHDQSRWGTACWRCCGVPKRWRRSAAIRALAASAVEEMLRYDGPTQAMTRIALEDARLDDASPVIRTGDRVFALLNAANRDPQVFADPERFNVARGDARHLSFGFGIHFCLGAPLARLEGQIAVKALVERLPDLALAIDEPEWSDSFVLRGVKALPVRFALASAELAKSSWSPARSVWKARSRSLSHSRRGAEIPGPGAGELAR